MLYTSLHGLRTDEEEVRRQVVDYFERNIPDEKIDDAMLAYLEDRILAPPDVVLDRWGSSRFYELALSPNGDNRHRTCETWFENGCQLPHVPGRNSSSEVASPPDILHFWTEIDVTDAITADEEETRKRLHEGTRLSITHGEHSSRVNHRTYGDLGELPIKLHKHFAKPAMLVRKYLCLVDKDPLAHRDDRWLCKLMVVTANWESSVADIVEHASRAFDASRSKC